MFYSFFIIVKVFIIICVYFLISGRVQMCEVSTKTTAEELENTKTEKTKDEMIEKVVKDDLFQKMTAAI